MIQKSTAKQSPLEVGRSWQLSLREEGHNHLTDEWEHSRTQKHPVYPKFQQEDSEIIQIAGPRI